MIKTQTIYNFAVWILAIICAAVLNLFLFGIMPGMIQKMPDKFKDMENIRTIQVVRIKHPDSDVRKKEHRKKEPETPKQKQKRIQTKVKLYKQKPVKFKPRLPFELNAELPSAINDLKMPPMENFDLKGQTGLFFEKDLDSSLIALAKIPPIYPLRAARRGIEGWVKIKFIVNTQGFVEKPEIIDSHPHKVFDKNVINCVSRWKFKPGTVDGVPVATMAETTIRFKLEQ